MAPMRLLSCSMAIVMNAQVLTDTYVLLFDITISKGTG
jgi:hypothetical protein